MALALGLLVVVVMRQPPTALDPEARVMMGFRTVEVRWRTAEPCETTGRVRVGKGPIRQFANAVETAVTDHTLLLKGLEPGRPYKVMLGGVTGPYRRPLVVTLEPPQPPTAVRVNRRGAVVAVEATAPLPVTATLAAYTGGQAFRSSAVAGVPPNRLVRVEVAGVPSYADVVRLDLTLSDRFADSSTYPLDGQPGTVSLLLDAPRDEHGQPLEAAVAAFSPDARQFFGSPMEPFERKDAVYRVTLDVPNGETLWEPFVAWLPSSPALVGAAPTVAPQRTEFPVELAAIPPSSKFVGEGRVFALHVDSPPAKGRVAYLRMSRSDLPPQTALHILVGEGFELRDPAGRRGAGEWFVRFPSDVLQERRLTMIRFVLTGPRGASLQLASVGLLIP